jgi:hypothetical protein
MGILDNAKQVAKAVEEIHNLELYQRVLNLHSDIIQLVEENTRLRAENQDLNTRIKLREKMQFKEPFYYQEGDQTPFCAACWECNGAAVHVTFGFDDDHDTRWHRPVCKCSYNVPKRGATRSHGNFGGGGGPDSWMR